jgi:hypothetical protein
MPSMTSDNMQRVFRRMLAREAGTGASASAIAAAGCRLCQRFADQFAPLIGDAGIAAIFSRSLHLAQPTFPGLAAANSPDRPEARFAVLQLFLEQQEPPAAGEAVVAVLGTAGELLASFIGAGLTTRLLREAWPDDFAAPTTEETS